MSSSLKYNPVTGKIEEEVNDVIVRTLDDPITNYVDYVPATDNARDIGSSTAYYKDFYIKGSFKDGTNTKTLAELLTGGETDKIITFALPAVADSKAWVKVPWDCTITDWTVTADASGDCVLDLWKDSYANFPPLVADTITASAKPTLSTAQKATSATLTGWTTSLTAGDYLLCNVDSASTATIIYLTLSVTRT